MEFSLIIPLYNESENVKRLIDEVQNALDADAQLTKYEVICVDDCSMDDTYNQLVEVTNNGFIVCKLRKHGGQSAALAAGVKLAKYEIVGFMDADLQSNPRDIARLLTRLQEGYDCVTGCRRRRNDPFRKRLSTTIARCIRQKYLSDNFYDISAPMKVLKKKCVEDLTFYDTFHRFIPVLIRMQGYSVVEVDIAHYPRLAGKSKYGISNRLWIGIKSMFAIKWMVFNWLDTRIQTEE
jgi:dolichol-phosphate mannosyltransferase